tara:strand:- start:442 stop:591 length:150 start_codon:yes stop_codon:yes gene_type:complete
METKEQRLKEQLEMHREWISEIRSNRKLYVLGGFMMGVGVFGVIMTIFT